jgi:hypothetical protein
VTDEYFDVFAAHVAVEQGGFTHAPQVMEFDDSSFLAQRHFRLSSLPMTESPGSFLRSMQRIKGGQERMLDTESLASVLHDAALFAVDPDCASEQTLAAGFLGHPFVRAFTSQINEHCFFGEAKEWLQAKCTDVPVPRRRDLTGHTQVLFRWIAELDPENFKLTRPNYSECLIRVRERVD